MDDVLRRVMKEHCKCAVGKESQRQYSTSREQLKEKCVKSGGNTVLFRSNGPFPFLVYERHT